MPFNTSNLHRGKVQSLSKFRCKRQFPALWHVFKNDWLLSKGCSPWLLYYLLFHWPVGSSQSSGPCHWDLVFLDYQSQVGILPAWILGPTVQWISVAVPAKAATLRWDPENAFVACGYGFSMKSTQAAMDLYFKLSPSLVIAFWWLGLLWKSLLSLCLIKGFFVLSLVYIPSFLPTPPCKLVCHFVSSGNFTVCYTRHPPGGKTKSTWFNCHSYLGYENQHTKCDLKNKVNI